MSSKKKVGILAGGPSGENYLSIRSSEVIIKNINKDKYDFIFIRWEKEGTIKQFKINSNETIEKEFDSIVSFISNCKIDIIYNTLHGEKENYGRLNGLFELMNIPYTGNGLYSSIIGINKSLSKIMFRFLNIPTLDFITIEKNEIKNLNSLIEKAESILKYPFILKPCLGGSSIDIHVAENQKEFIDKSIEIFSKHNVILVENFIKEKLEYSVGIFGIHHGNELIDLPVAKIDYEGDFFDEKIKHDDTYKVVIPSQGNPEIEKKLINYAKIIHLGMGFDSFSRSDFIVDKDDNIFVLEVNTHPGFSEYSIIPNMIKHTNLSIPFIIDKLIEDGLSRRINIYE